VAAALTCLYLSRTARRPSKGIGYALDGMSGDGLLKVMKDSYQTLAEVSAAHEKAFGDLSG
jgi:hypothetical protein